VVRLPTSKTRLNLENQRTPDKEAKLNSTPEEQMEPFEEHLFKRKSNPKLYKTFLPL
jgi:hypothetical protein